jgi:VCBS repeat-containing protein
MKRTGLLSNKSALNKFKLSTRIRSIISFILILATFAVPNEARAVIVGSGSCASTTSTSSAVVATSGGFCYLAVTATGANSWTVPAGVNSINFILIAGGGAGGAGAWGGGGGAGELVYQYSYGVTAGATLNFSIGSGGTSGTASLDPALNRSNNGGNSWFGSSSGVVALGGGAGASYAYNSGVASNATGSSGGSGGGGTEDVSVRNGGSATASSGVNRDGYGNAGGKGGPGAGTQAGGGGGGAGSAGTDAASTTGGNGGGGTTAFPSWLTAIRSGMSGISGWQNATTTGAIAGGGGGGTTTTAGSGGAGGGGAGGSNSTSYPGTDAISNTGSGGGGASYGGAARLGGAGGSGLLILRYVVPDVTAPTITGPGGATGASSSISIPETATSVFTFSASETVTWSKSGTDSSFFTIASSGALTVTARDFETPADSDMNNTYIVIITATDGSSNATSQTLTVTITNVNEAPVITLPNGNPTYSISQQENNSNVLTYSATDVDSGTTLAWSISGTDAGDFNLSPNGGALTFVANPDFEAPMDSDSNNIYLIVVTVSDGALTDTQTVTITISDVNESSTLGSPSVSGAIYKGVTTAITVTSNSAGKVRFFVSGKRIPNCLAVPTSGSGSTFTATCSWKPAVQNKQYLTASITPTLNSFSASSSPKSEIFILKRNGIR